MIRHIPHLLIFLTLYLSGTLSYDFSQFQIIRTQKIVNLNSAYPQQLAKLEYKCLSDQCEPLVYYLQLQPDANKIAVISFHKDKPSGTNLNYSTISYQHNNANYLLYKIQIRAMTQNQNYILVINIAYFNRYINYPLTIQMTQDQKFQYEDNKYLLAPYFMRDIETTYKFSKIPSSFDPDGQKKGLSNVLFRKSNLPAFSYIPHIIHGVNNQPQVYFSQVVREIEVSHWGNIAITQFYKIKNIGPGIKGQFSRVKFSSNNKFQSKNSWRGMQTILPYQIWGLYFRDEVGNISTSRAYRDDNQEIVKFFLAPRFSLLGGWKTNWEIGYNLHTEKFLMHQQNKFQLNKIPIQYALSTVLTEKYTMRIILPQTSTDVHLFIGGNAVNMNEVTKGISFGYLDFTGRPTFTIDNLKGLLKKTKLVVRYQFNQTSIFKKPLIVFAAIFSILLLIIVLNRLNMSAFEERQVKMEKMHHS